MAIKQLKDSTGTNFYPYTEVNAIVDAETINKIPQVIGTSAASVTIDPYKFYDFGTVSQSMTIVFNTSAEVSGYMKEYMIRFVAGNGCNITLPNGTLWSGGSAPIFTATHTYEIDIVNGCAVVGEFY